MVGIAQLYQLQLRRNHFYVMGIAVCVLVVIASTLIHSHTSEESSTSVMNQKAEHIGTIVVQRGESRCEQRRFDNDNGRVGDRLTPCDAKVVLDAHGVPLHQVADPRLNAISKSFSGR